MQRNIRRLRFVVGLVNVAVFVVLGIHEHREWTRNAKLASGPYETFSCTMLERRAIPPKEKEGDWWWCCYECRPSGEYRLFIFVNLGAFLLAHLLMGLAADFGFHNQVVFFYGFMPLAIIFWWCLMGTIAHVLMKRRRRLSEPRNSC